MLFVRYGKVWIHPRQDDSAIARGREMDCSQQRGVGSHSSCGLFSKRRKSSKINTLGNDLNGRAEVHNNGENESINHGDD